MGKPAYQRTSASSCRALHLIDSHQRRGAEVFASQLAACLEQRGTFTNSVCSLYQGGKDALPLVGLPVFRLEGAKRSLARRLGVDPSLLWRLRAVLQQVRPQVVVAHGGDTLKYAALAGMLRRETVTVYRNIGHASFWNGSRLRVGLNRLWLRNIDAVVSVSQLTREDFVRLYRFPAGRVTFIPNGVDAADFDRLNPQPTRSQVRAELGIPPDTILLISVGNLSVEKGPDELLRAMGHLAYENVDWRLALVGDGPLRPLLEQQAQQMGIAQRTRFLGRREDVARLLLAADLFVLSSRTEGMPAVLIEAGLAGLPAVAFNVGGVAEVVEDGVTGALVAPGDSAGLANSLAALAGDAARRRQLGAAAWRRCRERFEIRRVAQQYEELFRGLLEHKAPAESLDLRAGAGR